MLRGIVTLAVAVLVLAPTGAGADIDWRRSSSLGLPWDGRLVSGVRLPADGRRFFTWDPIRKRSPNRPGRRYGNDRLVRTVLHVLERYARAHRDAPRVGVGDLSRPRGGDFGPRHASHQNGLDVDVYYPRRDRRERAPTRVGQVDRRLAQDLVDRFVRAGATKVFVGADLGLTGPPRVVQTLASHDDHLHARIPPDRVSLLLGRSHRDRPIRAWRIGEKASARKLLVVGCIHGDECAGLAVTRRLLRSSVRPRGDVWIVPSLNPDGLAAGHRQNGRGVDLNRNFHSEWRRIGRRWSPQYSGPRPWSERETRVARALIERLRPDVTVWFHQPQALVRAWGRSIPAARRYARLARMPFRAIRWPNGTAPNWQNHRLGRGSAFVVELPAGPLDAAAARRHADALRRLAE